MSLHLNGRNAHTTRSSTRSFTRKHPIALQESDMHNSIGIIEPFKDGFIEIIPEGEGSDYWQIAALHINGEVFCPSPRIFSSTNVAFARARKIYNWICDREIETRGWGCYCEEYNIILWRVPKSYPSCPLPAVNRENKIIPQICNA